MLFAIDVSGQKKDDRLIKLYENDTLGFKAYPDVYLLENLKLSQKYSTLEMNSWVMEYALRNTPSHGKFYNLYRYTKSKRVHFSSYANEDTLILSKSSPDKMFSGCLCPSIQPWYISAKNINNDIITVNDTTTLKTFLGNLKNPFNSYLWLKTDFLFAKYKNIPIKTDIDSKYKKVKDGILISFGSLDDSGVHMASAEFTYLVTPDFKIFFISKKHEVVSKIDFRL